ncbi:MAG: cation-translocating P-type ATPase [Metamycoplasmataceae bacterium]
MNNDKNNNSDESPSEKEEYLKTKIDQGLSSEEVEQRQKLFGLNSIKKDKQVSFFILFLRQLTELMSLLLLVAGILSLALSIYQQTRGEDVVLQYTQTAILLSIVFINSLFGSIQEIKSNNAIEELEKMTSSNAKVIRNGIITLINSNEITIGDILIVEAGDTIQADAMLLEVNNLQVIESILTGESNAIDKNLEKTEGDIPLGDQKNKIFSGTNVINGRGVAIVVSIGNNTEIGKVAKLISDDKNKTKTPLQYKLHNLSKYLGIVGIIITILTFFFSLFIIENVVNEGFKAVQPSLILAISLAAAAIPEGLNAVVNIILSIGVKKMSRKNAIIKKLPAVETLGSTSVICSDKTGTLTMNKMTITNLWAFKNNYVEKQNLIKLSKEQIELLKYAVLCTDASIDENNLEETPVGDPTELCILELALKNKFSPITWDKEFPRITTIPFDSNRKLMTSINQIDDEFYVIVKGAPDVIFSKCKNIDDDTEIKKINNSWSNKAIRVLGVGIKKINKNNLNINNLDINEIENDLDFIGLIGMIDPPREEVKLSIKECISAGIKPVMITGDHLNTAVAIAIELGIITNPEIQKSITGTELNLLSDEYLKEHINDYSVYARVSPEDKLRIVKAWQANNQVVAMTGDGVNDAPALKAADIGCAMGITGTDVSKGAADMILTDDNFSTIIESVKSGRSIYESIRNIVKFLLSSNIAGIISIVLGMIIFYFVFEIGNWGYLNESTFNGVNITIDQANAINSNIKFQTTLTTIQILINNIVIETLPGVALGIQENTSSLMNRRPRSKYESIFADKLIIKIFVTGIINGLLTILAFTLGVFVAIETGVPMLRFFYGNIAAFISLTIGGILKSISMSSKISIFKTKWGENKWVYLACFVSFAIILISTLIPPVASLFGERPVISEELIKNTNLSIEQLNKIIFNNSTVNDMLNWELFLIGFSFGLIPLIILEIEKYFKNNYGSHKIISNITTFEIIPKPLTFQEKYPIFKKFKKD